LPHPPLLLRKRRGKDEKYEGTEESEGIKDVR
jgi:hypothetical protein